MNLEILNKEYSDLTPNQRITRLYKDFKEELIPINLLIPEMIERYKISIIEGDKNLSSILKYIILNQE